MSTRTSCAAPLVGAPTPPSTERVRLRALDAGGYARHALHGEERVWSETNCYVDLWIEALHGLGLDPMPALAFTLALDFEGDQYTFYKFAHADLLDLYGVDVQELNVWKPVVEHAVEQVAMGRLLLVEVDSYWLPDTAGVSYRIEHTKTTIGIQDVDVAARRLGYFHGAGYHELADADFDGVFRLAPGLAGPDVLPPFAEIAKLDAAREVDEAERVARARALLGRYLARRPATNPVERHLARFPRDLQWLRDGEPGRFHQYAFATFRQLGSCFELAGSFLDWLAARGEPGLDVAAAECRTIASTAKALQFKLARAVALRRDVDFATGFAEMSRAWDAVMTRLAARDA